MKRKIYISFSLATLLGGSVTALGQGAPAAEVVEPAAPPALQNDPGQDYFERANQLYKAAGEATDLRLKERYYGSAIPIFRNYIKTYPKHKNAQVAWYYLGESYYQTAEVKTARETFKTIINFYKSGAYVAASAYRLAHDSYSLKNYDDAARYFEIAALNSTNEEDKTKSIYYRAQSLTIAGKEKEALEFYDIVSNVIENNPYRERATLTYAKLLLRESEFEKAIVACERLLVPKQMEEVKAEAAYYAGVAANGAGEIGQAEKYYNMVMHSGFDDWKGQAQTGLMGIRYSEKDFAGVLKFARLGKFEMSPKFKVKQGIIVGQSYYQMKNYANAIEYFIDVEKHAKGTDDAFSAGYYKLLSFYNLKIGEIGPRVDRFLLNYAAGRGKHKFIHQALLMKAESLYSAKKYKEASEAYSSISTKFIDEKYHESVGFRKANCLSKVENYVGAVNAFTVYITQFPSANNIQNAYLIRADLYAMLDNRAKALRDYDKVIKDAPKSKEVSIALQRSAQVQLLNKNYDEMILRYEKLIKEYPELSVKVRANAYYWIGRGYFKNRKFEEGVVNIERCRKLDSVRYKKQISMLRVIGHFSLRNVSETVEAVEDAEKNDLGKKIQLNVYRWLGGEFYNNDEFVKASDYLKKGVEHGSAKATPIPIWRVLSKSQMRAGRYQEAFLSVSNLLSLEKDKSRQVDALLDKAKIQAFMGKTGDSKRTAESALELNPTGKTQAELIKIVGDFYYVIGEHNNAAKYYVRLVDMAEDLDFHVQVLDRLSTSLTRLGDTAESEKYAGQLKLLYPKYKREPAE